MSIALQGCSCDGFLGPESQLQLIALSATYQGLKPGQQLASVICQICSISVTLRVIDHILGTKESYNECEVTIRDFRRK